jgi:hypothetical protein
MFDQLLKRFEVLQTETQFKGKLAGAFSGKSSAVFSTGMEQRGLQLFERLRPILEFFATAAGNAENTSNMLLVRYCVIHILR